MDYRYARFVRKLSQQDVADRIGCAQTTVSAIERGKTKSGACKLRYEALFAPKFDTDGYTTYPHVGDWLVLSVGIVAAGFFLIKTEPTALLIAAISLFAAYAVLVFLGILVFLLELFERS